MWWSGVNLVNSDSMLLFYCIWTSVRIYCCAVGKLFIYHALPLTFCFSFLQNLQLTNYHLILDQVSNSIKLKEEEFGVKIFPISKKLKWLHQSLITVINVARFILEKETCKDIWLGNVVKNLTRSVHTVHMPQTAKQMFRNTFEDGIKTCQILLNSLYLTLINALHDKHFLYS